MFTALQAQEIVKGVVLDNTGEPLPGVYIESESGQRTETDANGKYTITAKQGESLTFSFIGKEDIVKEVTSEVLNVEFYSKISEVVVTAQGIKREEKSLGYGVTTIGNEDFQSKQQTDIITSITGKVPGLNILKTSGIVGVSSDVTIRGRSSLVGQNAPFYIVDGVPTTSYLILDSEDIKTTTVLKGLMGSVLYGSEGRNGVILIETKNNFTNSQEKERKLNIQLKQGVYVTSPHLPDYQNTYGQGTDHVANVSTFGNWGAPFSEGITVPHHYDQPRFAESFPQYQGVTERYQAYPDNVKDFFRDGIGQNTYVNISQGNKNTSIGLSAGYTQEQGYLYNNNLKKINFSLGGRAQWNRFTFNSNIHYGQSHRRLPDLSMFPEILFTPRNLDLKNLPYEAPVTHQMVSYNPSLPNHYWKMKYAGIESDVLYFHGGAKIDYKLNPYLHASYLVGLSQSTNDVKSWDNKLDISDPLGSMSQSNSILTKWEHNLLLNLDRFDFGNFYLNASMGAEARQEKNKSTSASASKQIIFGYTFPQGFEENLASRSNYTVNLIGLYAQGVLGYKNYAYLTLAGRNDWSSVTVKENNSKFFPSVSLSFIPTDAFNINSSVLNYLKTRVAYSTSAGYPLMGGVDTHYNLSKRVYAKDDGSYLHSVSRSSFLGNPEIKPELHREFEVGFDSDWLSHRISLDASFYYRISKDQLITVNLDPSCGYYSTYENQGRADNKGIEVGLEIIPLKTKYFTWSMNNLFNTTDSRVFDIKEERKMIAGYLDLGGFAMNGYPYGILMGAYALRDEQGRLLINPNDGTLINSRKLGMEDKILGDPNPDYKLTNINTFSYKGWRLKTQLEYTHGGIVVAQPGNTTSTTGNGTSTLLLRGITKDTEDREGYFIIPGVLGDPTTGKPILDETGKEIPNTLATPLQHIYFNNYMLYREPIFDGSILRLREVSLSYTLPERLLKHTFIHSVSFTLSGQNLWYYTPNIPKHLHFDPDTKSTNSRARRTEKLDRWDLDSPMSDKRYSFAITINF